MLADPVAVDAMMVAIQARFGGPNILVDNASVRHVSPLAEMDLTEFRAIQSANVGGPCLCAEAALPMMAASGGGAIVNIGGLTGDTCVRDRLQVSASKAALYGMTVGLALKGSSYGATVYMIEPRSIDTLRPGGHRHALGYFGSNKFLDRKGKPEEILGMVQMVCGPGARNITAQTIHVNEELTCRYE